MTEPKTKPAEAVPEVPTPAVVKEPKVLPAILYITHPATDGVGKCTREAYEALWKAKGWVLSDRASYDAHQAVLAEAEAAEQAAAADDGQEA